MFHLLIIIGLVFIGFVFIAGLLWWVITQIETAFGLPRPVVIMVEVFFVVACLIALLAYANVIPGLHLPGLHL